MAEQYREKRIKEIRRGHVLELGTDRVVVMYRPYYDRDWQRYVIHFREWNSDTRRKYVPEPYQTVFTICATDKKPPWWPADEAFPGVDAPI